MKSRARHRDVNARGGILIANDDTGERLDDVAGRYLERRAGAVTR
jgi:hypothetical protein